MARGTGWPKPQIHYEYLCAEVKKSLDGGSFEVKLASSGKIVVIPRDQTDCEALMKAGVEILM